MDPGDNRLTVKKRENGHYTFECSAGSDVYRVIHFLFLTFLNINWMKEIRVKKGTAKTRKKQKRLIGEIFGAEIVSCEMII
ncbi:hypothetical protein CW304_27150 [Bacillus sp. UFRGS-B20]|nr:hypothetical protein CW304_27150 [Bacillus sp. UFRGS-B20]